MPVNLSPPDPNSLHPVAGVTLGVAEAGIKKPNRKDLLVINFAEGAHVAGVFTQNRFCAAPVAIAIRHLEAATQIRALVINTGNANAGTGDDGIRRAELTCADPSILLSCDSQQALPFSTGVIMEQLPVERITAGLPKCVAALRPDGWADAAQAIMTTDTVAKAASRQVQIGGK